MNCEDGVGAYPLLPPQRQRIVSERVVADRREEVDLGPEPRAADRLVRALAAVVAPERAADHRLPRSGHAVKLDRQADPVAPDDRDPRHGANLLARRATSGARHRTCPFWARNRLAARKARMSRGANSHVRCQAPDV